MSCTNDNSTVEVETIETIEAANEARKYWFQKHLPHRLFGIAWFDCIPRVFDICLDGKTTTKAEINFIDYTDGVFVSFTAVDQYSIFQSFEKQIWNNKVIYMYKSDKYIIEPLLPDYARIKRTDSIIEGLIYILSKI
jgi:hypothetical protein